MIKLASLPAAPAEHAVTFSRLDGGLNLLEVDYRLRESESPDMVNLWWRDGVLCSRDGQVRLTSDEPLGAGYSAYEMLFWDHGFFHIGDGLWHGDLSDPDAAAGSLTLEKLCDGVPESPGSWFRYGDGLYYKNAGGYFVVSRQLDIMGQSIFSAGPVEPYAPVILINASPGAGTGDAYQPENRICEQKTVWYTADGTQNYVLPVTGVDSVDRVVVDGVELTAGTEYTADLTAGTVTFPSAPPLHNPVEANTVKITYSKRNPEAMASVMDCRYAAVYGGDQNVCVVLAGCPAQPNAFFWCGNHAAMDPGYFPMEQYNLAGNAEEGITGFGRQQDMLVIFKERSVGRAGFEGAEMSSGRVLLSMPYTAINSRVGCDLPGSIQLVENNLVFANSGQGVFLIRDSSAAFENNIVCISRKVNGSPLSKGLLRAVKEGNRISSFDDDARYWLCCGDEVYVWDYTISDYQNPSWFYLSGVPGVAFLKAAGASMHLDDQGRVSILRRNWQDYGTGIEKRYRFATQCFGGYDRLKDVTRCVFAVRGDTDTEIEIEYETDYGSRHDLTPIMAYSWRLSPRNLLWRFLGVRKFATTAVRRPGCRHVRHFSMTLSNDLVGMDMAVISASVFYRYQGRDR